MKIFNLFRRVCVAAILLATIQHASAEIRLPKVFGNHMVFQQDQPLVIWGWAAPNETVTIEFASKNVQAQANARGEWKAELPALKASGPFILTVSGSSSVKFEDVMVGEVWLCSGQSNMEMGTRAAKDGKQEVAAAVYPGIRLFLIPKKIAPTPQDDIDATWKLCSPDSIVEGGWEGFSAAGYFFGRELHKKLGVTVGLIESSWGGTRIEPWTPPIGFASVPELKKESDIVELGDPHSDAHKAQLRKSMGEIRRWLAAANKALTNETGMPPIPNVPSELRWSGDLQSATSLYNAMIHPIQTFGIRGAIWYQGESNLRDGTVYRDRMKALVRGWRTLWHEGDFPFYYVQIAPYNYGGDPEAEGVFWEAQTDAQEIPNTGMVVINDIGNLNDIHPKNKQEVGRRLALWALAKTYHQDIPVFSGPVFKSMTVEDAKAKLTFDNIGSGLASRDGKPLSWFQVVDAEDGGFVPAHAEIVGQNVIVSAPSVSHPAAVRFAWSMLAEPNLMNVEGFPAGAFRTGSIPKRDLLALKVPESANYKLVYDIDLNKASADMVYDVDNHEKIAQPFDRIAYFMELQKEDGSAEYLYASMDAFSSDLTKIGVPTVKSGASFQVNVSNLTVISNVKGIEVGTNLSGGNIEFWPNNYAQENEAKVPNASSLTYDFGDQIVGSTDGYGSMQIHNHDAKQTLFAFNHWREGEHADVGIGNQPSANPDWTFAANAGNWPIKRLRVLVHCK